MRFLKFESIYDSNNFFYAAVSPNRKEIEGVKFIEVVTPDFKRVQFIREDGLKFCSNVDMEMPK